MPKGNRYIIKNPEPTHRLEDWVQPYDTSVFNPPSALEMSLNAGVPYLSTAKSAIAQALSRPVNMGGPGVSPAEYRQTHPVVKLGDKLRSVGKGVVDLTTGFGGLLQSGGQKMADAFGKSPLGVVVGSDISNAVRVATGKPSQGISPEFVPAVQGAVGKAGKQLSPFPEATIKDGKVALGEYNRSFSPMIADLKKVGLPEYLYHGTTKAGAKDILANGFDPKKSIANGGLISYTDNPEFAKYYGPEVIKVKASDAGIIDQVDDTAYGVKNYFGTKAVKPVGTMADDVAGVVGTKDVSFGGFLDKVGAKKALNDVKALEGFKAIYDYKRINTLGERELDQLYNRVLKISENTYYQRPFLPEARLSYKDLLRATDRISKVEAIDVFMHAQHGRGNLLEVGLGLPIENPWSIRFNKALDLIASD